MKLIVAIVRSFKVTEIVDGVEADPEFPGMTVLEVRGFGREKSAPHLHVPQEDLLDFVDRAAILVAARDDRAEALVERLTALARTGQPGDGKVFVLPVEAAVRIATGEHGEA
ncbi:MAG: P-II family nitrogen regulator, partial [Gemmatimonadota bacterium]